MSGPLSFVSGLLSFVSGPLIFVSSLLIGVGRRCSFYILLYVLFVCPFCPFCHQRGWQKGQKGHFFSVFPYTYTRARIYTEKENDVSHASYVSRVDVTMLHYTKTHVDT